MGKMKILFLTFWLTLVASLVQAHSVPDLLASYHFIGAEALSTNQQAAKLKQIWELPQTKNFRDLVLGRIAGNSEKLSDKPLKDSADLVRPLFDDLLTSESLAQLRHASNGPGEFVLAIHLNAERAGIWQNNFSKLAANWFEAKPAGLSEKSDWELKRKKSPDLLRFTRVGEWTVIGLGEKDLPLQQNLSEIIRKNGRPENLKTNWFEAEIDLPALQKWFPAAANTLFNPAHFWIEISPRSGDLRTNIRAVYPQKFASPLKPWQMPTNIIRDPLISFTAAQNLSFIMKTPRSLQQLGFNPLTNQFYLWAQSSVPFFSFAAAPDQNATNTILRVSEQAPRVFNDILAARRGGRLLGTNSALVWDGLPLIRPELHAVKEKAGEFLMAGLFVRQASTNPPPMELLMQVFPRKNLIYYDWELSQERLGQWQLLSKLLPVFPADPEPKTKAKISRIDLLNRLADERWLSVVSTNLGNTVTEATLENENEIHFTRKSAMGFTAAELVWLAHWLNEPDFLSFEQKSSANKKSRKK